MPCDGVHLGDARCVWVLLESEPILDSPHGPNALSIRRSGARTPQSVLCLARSQGRCRRLCGEIFSAVATCWHLRVKIWQRQRVVFSVSTAITVAVGGLSFAALLPSAQAAHGGTITVGSYNIHKSTLTPEPGVPDWNFRRDRLGLILAESTADVISLQEVVGWRLPTGPKHRDHVASVASAKGFATINSTIHRVHFGH